MVQIVKKIQSIFVWGFIFVSWTISVDAKGDILDKATSIELKKILIESLSAFENDLQIGGSNFFVAGFIEQFKSSPDVPLSLDQLRKYLPNYLLRKFYQDGANGSDVMGKYTAASLNYFSRIRLLCGGPLLTESQAKPIRDKLLGLEKNIIDLLKEYNLQDYQKKDHFPEIARKIQIMIRSQILALTDPTCFTAPLEATPEKIVSIVDSYKSLLQDLLVNQINKEEFEAKYGITVNMAFSGDKNTPAEISYVFRIDSLPEIFMKILQILSPNIHQALSEPEIDSQLKPYRELYYRLEKEKEEFDTSNAKFIEKPATAQNLVKAYYQYLDLEIPK